MHTYLGNDHQLAPRRDGNQACLECHSEIGTKLEAHTRHRASSSGSRCYNGHMQQNKFSALLRQRDNRSLELLE